jgi:hypothetical protein
MEDFIDFCNKGNPISDDEGIHHKTQYEQRRLVVHGLLIATLTTKVG